MDKRSTGILGQQIIFKISKEALFSGDCENLYGEALRVFWGQRDVQLLNGKVLAMRLRNGTRISFRNYITTGWRAEYRLSQSVKNLPTVSGHSYNSRTTIPLQT
mmetsp:Transcript_6990/g.17108  ORF Transcript_6990/g.17108 Transcript_6990/m.17108 type:complete len:104 (-) Transcript_6990:149-460(-)